jgi:hypothetical protein
MDVTLSQVLIELNCAAGLLPTLAIKQYEVLHLVKVSIVTKSYLVELNPTVGYVLSLFLLEGALALIFVLKEYSSFTSLGAIRVLANLNGIMVCIEVFKEGDDVLISA